MILSREHQWRVLYKYETEEYLVRDVKSLYDGWRICFRWEGECVNNLR